MKGKKVSNYEFNLPNLVAGMPSLIINNEKVRKTALNYKTKQFIVDTCCASDTGCWETGISAKGYNSGDWIIVSEYKNEKEAIKGHKKWIIFMKKKPTQLTDIHIDEVYKVQRKK